MKKIIMLLTLLIPAAAFGQSAEWSAVEKVFPKMGSVSDEIYKVSLPRSDLHVKIGRVSVKPGLALGSWIGFMKAGNETMVMGDLVLLEKEYGKVMKKLMSSGIEVTALHNHLVNETPRVLYIHYYGKGDASVLAKSLKDAISLTGTPLTATAPKKAKSSIDWSKVESILGKKGTNKGDLIQFSFPLDEKVTEDGAEIPPAMGVATAINIQMDKGEAATTGDFVLTAGEVNPVAKALTEHGIAVAAVHSHMLTESPRLFFMHFWGTGKAEELARGLKAALDETKIKK